jgi:hypothetical protein
METKMVGLGIELWSICQIQLFFQADKLKYTIFQENINQL